ncbi:L-threonylcarbamoyladenylate synthase [Krasilnikovia sp. M28-CT-15]|uniref:L-threonylcarbamoyladenylate synthase n=1 Tax=Krasilnikovia sp. M28-CT-15 TaxID=3373540 RepID=UPI003876210D
MIVAPDDAGIRRAVRLLRAGSVVAFPTETVYGLGADATSADAIAEIYRLKQRPSWNPLIVHVADVAQARALARRWPAVAEELADRFWPGPLTVVVERAAGLPGDLDTVALRIPAHPVALRLLRESGLALAAPSANRSESISPTTAQHVLASLPEVPLVLDGGPAACGIESTVVDLTVSPPRLLRPGALGLRALREVTGPLTLPGGVVSGAVAGQDDARPDDGTVVADGVARPSPGMSRRHYAPRARLILAEDVSAVPRAGLAGPVAVLTYEGRGSGDEVLSADPGEYAADLYAALHRLDDARAGTILVQAPPDTEDWLAIRDRLGRAAA